ncbi:hypothetical protein K0U00_42155, partial [Paenibacillus sepulcri]|nr:hypothetical protein [Paenibacillus sepulcri]
WVGGSSQADWINKDQIAYIGPDGSLYAYDLRNAAVTVLLGRVGSFQLSPDRKYIAYWKGKGSTTKDMRIYAGKLQGNNILNETAVYQGVVPFQMAWNPDNSGLLIEGQKVYAREAGPAQPTQSAPSTVPSDLVPLHDNQSFIIEFE